MGNFDENEVLFARGTKFKVLRVEKEYLTPMGGGRVREALRVYMEEL